MSNEFIARNGIIALNNTQVTGSLSVTNGITGSLLGTASYASSANSASYATTASYWSGSITNALSSSYAANSTTASYALNTSETLATVTGRGATTNTAVTFNNTVAVNNTSFYNSSVYSLDINGGLLVKNTSKTASFTIINADPSAGGNNAFVVHTVGGTSGTSYVDIQGYYGTSIAGSTTIRLNNAGGNVLIGSLAGTGTRMVVTDATGILSTQAIPTLSSLGAQAALSGTGFVKISGTTISYDNSTYLTTSAASSTYQTILTNPVTGTGTTNYLPKFTGTSTIGNSLVYDDGTNVTINGSAATSKLKIVNPLSSSLFQSGIEFIRTTVSGGSKIEAFRDAAIGGVGLSFQVTANNTAEINATYTQAMLLTTSGNLGLGVTPSAWGSSFKALEGFYGQSWFYRNDALASGLTANTYNNGTNWIYSTTNASQRFEIGNVGFAWFTAPSGTQGAAISFTQAMTLNASGNLSIGNTNDTYKLDVNGTGRFNGSLQVGQGSGGTGTATQSVFQDTYGGNREAIYIKNTADYSPGRGSGYGFQSGAGTERGFLRWYADDATQTGYSFGLAVTNSSGTLYTPFSLASTGAATFSSSVTAGQIGVQAAPLSGVSLTAQENATNGVAMAYVNRNSTKRFDFIVDVNAVDDKAFGIYDRTNGAYRFNITDAGNVGIGTTSPGTTLDINASGGVGGFTGFRLKYGTSSVQSLNMGQVTAGNGAWIGMAQYRLSGYWQTEGTAASVLLFDSDGTFSISTNSGLTANTDYNLSIRMLITNGGQLKLATYTSTSSWSGTAAAYLAVDSSGNVITVAGGGGGSYLPLTGGTLTGALNGTSLSLSGNQTMTSVNPTLTFTTTSNGGRSANIGITDGANMYVPAATNGNLYLGSGTTTFIQGGLSGNSTANFSSSVTAASFSGAGTGLTGTASSLSIGGNAATATTLQTARNIQGVSFNGSADIIVLTSGTGVSVSGTQVSIGQSVATSAAPTFGGLTISNTNWGLSTNTGYWSTNNYLGAQGDYIQHVILLCPIYNGTLINYNKIVGKIYSERGSASSGLISDTYEIDVSSAYSGTVASLKGTNTNGKLYTCTYGGVKWIALMPTYRVSAVGYFWDGYTSVSSGTALTIVSYYNSNTSTVLNSEINSSLVAYNSTSPTYFDAPTVYISNNIALHAGNYNSYSPTLTGGNASGTWGISITGNAATLGGYGPNQSSGAYTIVQRDVNGYIQNSYFYTSGGGSERGTNISYVAGFNSSDYYIRSYTLQGLASAMSGVSMNISGTATNITAYTINQNLGTGNAPTFAGLYLNAGYLYFNDTDRDAGSSTYYPNAWARGTRFSFANASTTGTGGNYAGVLHFHPWDGTTSSTGDASYQLAFGSTAANGGGYPQLRIRKGIDTTWNSWVDILTSVNYSSYALPLSGGAITGTLSIKNTSSLVQAPYQSDHDFPNGAYIQTDIAVSSGEPWTCEITAFNYGNGRPTKITINAYNYGPGTYYAGYAISTGLVITGMSVFQNASGYLSLYIPSQGYWNAYNVNWYVNYRTNSSNRVTSISNSTKPTGISYENAINPTYSLDTANSAYAYNMNQYVRTTDNVSFARVDSTNYGVGNAIYFGGGNNYFNWTNSRIYSNVGIESAGSMYSNGYQVVYNSGTWGINISGNAANVTGVVAIGNGGTGATSRKAASSAVANFGQLEPHGTYTDANYVQQWGGTYVQSYANGHGFNGNTQYYQMMLSLGSQYDWGTGNTYAMQIMISRNVTTPYIGIRYKEGGGDTSGWGGWQKISAGYADSAGNAATATTASSVSGLTLTSSANNLNPDNVTQNQLGYNTSVSLFGQTDGGLYSSAYSSSWIHQIYGDFRTGQIAIRGKNNGTWQAWRTVLDSSNYSSYATPIRVQSNWNDSTVINNVVGLLAWKNYGNPHVIFDASQGTSPSGGGVSQTNSTYAWTASYPTLMGWNGSGTYGVRVDSARVADSASSANAANYISPRYDGFVSHNPQDYFNNGIGLKVAMTGHVSVWSDTVWINGYTGGDVPYMCALHTIRNSQPRMWITSQRFDATSYGSAYEFVTEWNIASYSAGNANSISNAVGGAYTWTNSNYFQTNKGGYLGTLDTAGLEAYSTGNNSAFMSFHKAGIYAINMGLDADNVFRIGGWSASPNRLQLDMSGNLTMAGDVTAYSDARVKTNIQTIENALDKILALRGVSYNRTDSDDKKIKIGVIAQETLPILPEVVNQDNDGMYNVSYGNMAGLFIEAIKEQQKQIEELKSIINGLTK